MSINGVNEVFSPKIKPQNSSDYKSGDYCRLNSIFGEYGTTDIEKDNINQNVDTVKVEKQESTSKTKNVVDSDVENAATVSTVATVTEYTMEGAEQIAKRAPKALKVLKNVSKGVSSFMAAVGSAAGGISFVADSFAMSREVENGENPYVSALVNYTPIGIAGDSARETIRPVCENRSEEVRATKKIIDSTYDAHPIAASFAAQGTFFSK